MLGRPKTPEQYVDLVDQALFEIEDLRLATEYDMDSMGAATEFLADLGQKELNLLALTYKKARSLEGLELQHQHEHSHRHRHYHDHSHRHAELVHSHPHEHEQPSPGMMIFFVRLEVWREVGDARGQQGNLYLRRTRVFPVLTVLVDNCLLLFCAHCHDISPVISP